jgi:hypothetical protein
LQSRRGSAQESCFVKRSEASPHDRIGLSADDLHAFKLNGWDELIRSQGLILSFEDDQPVPHFAVAEPDSFDEPRRLFDLWNEVRLDHATPQIVVLS